MTKDDLPLKVAWYNDPEIRETLILNEILELGKTIQWFEAVKDSQSRLDLIIETLEGKPIGVTGFIEIESENQSAEIFIVVGEKNYWAKGVMYEAHKLLIEWGFVNLPITRIFGVCKLNNIGSIVTLKKLGFQQDCLLKQDKGINVYRYVLEKQPANNNVRF
jgi:RimJ/RimL family protein N-acetyltransferase